MHASRLLCPSLLLSASLLAGTASAALVTFGTNADYDNNFYEPSPSADITRVATSGGIIQKTSANASSAIYNTTATGGSNGSGGTGVTTANNNTFTDVLLKVDFSTATFVTGGGDSAGFITRLDSTATNGYLTIFRITANNIADIRFYDSNSTGGGGPGTLRETLTLNLPANTFSLNTFYTFQLAVENIAGQTRFTGSIFNAGGGAQIGTSQTYTDTTSPVVSAGQVGVRFGSTASGTAFDNFSVEAIPEPASALLGFGALAVFFRRKR